MDHCSFHKGARRCIVLTLLPAMASLGQNEKEFFSVTNKYASVFLELSIKTPDLQAITSNIHIFGHSIHTI